MGSTMGRYRGIFAWIDWDARISEPALAGIFYVREAGSVSYNSMRDIRLYDLRRKAVPRALGFGPLRRITSCLRRLLGRQNNKNWNCRIEYFNEEKGDFYVYVYRSGRGSDHANESEW